MISNLSKPTSRVQTGSPLRSALKSPVQLPLVLTHLPPRAVGVTSIAVFARLARSRVVGVRVTDYVEAAYGSGGTFFGVLWRHVLPNSLTPVIALAALQFGSAILQISTLGFLGYGAPPPTPEWGLLIAEGRNYVATAWWLTVLPGVVVVLVVLATNRLSQALRGGDVA